MLRDKLCGGGFMQIDTFLDILHTAEKLKDTTRHCVTSKGRHESVAEHSWRAALMAYFLKDEFEDLDMQKVMLMCLVHDLGECFTGDIPTFNKTAADEERENKLLFDWLSTLPAPYCAQLTSLFEEMLAQRTSEAKLFKAIDNLEAVIQHNEAPIESWAPNEYSLNLTYAVERCKSHPYLALLRERIKQDTIDKIENEGK